MRKPCNYCGFSSIYQKGCTECPEPLHNFTDPQPIMQIIDPDTLTSIDTMLPPRPPAPRTSPERPPGRPTTDRPPTLPLPLLLGLDSDGEAAWVAKVLGDRKPLFWGTIGQRSKRASKAHRKARALRRALES